MASPLVHEGTSLPTHVIRRHFRLRLYSCRNALQQGSQRASYRLTGVSTLVAATVENRHALWKRLAANSPKQRFYGSDGVGSLQVLVARTCPKTAKIIGANQQTRKIP